MVRLGVAAGVLFGGALLVACAASAQEPAAAAEQSPNAKASPSTVEEGGDNDDTAQETAEQRRRRLRRMLGGMAKLTLAGHELSVGYPELERGSEDYQALEALADGAVFQPTRGQAIKLKTAASLRFADLLIEEENVATDYPGVYSLWLKKLAPGWRLVFNQEPDVWGTMHDPQADVGEVPLELSETDAGEGEAASFKVELLEADGGGVLRMVWGPYQWRVPFQLAE